MNAPSTVRFKYFNDNVVQPGVYTSSAYAVHYGSASLNLLGYDSFELDMARATSEFDPAASLQVYLEFNGEKVKNLALPSTSVPYVWTQADFGGVDFSAINDVRISADFSPIGSAELLPEFDLDFTQFRAVPEPHTFALISLGLVGFGLSRRRGTR